MNQTKYIKENVSIASFAESIYGLSFERDGKGVRLRCKQHDSLLVDTRSNYFFWNSRAEQGDIFRFIQVYEMYQNGNEISFYEAKKKANQFLGVDYQPSQQILDAKNAKVTTPVTLEVPKKVNRYDKIASYLCGSRKIDFMLASDLIKKNRLYQDERNNICFVGIDEKGKVQYIMQRGTGKSVFKGDAFGSIIEVGFYYSNKDKTKKIILTESIIDALSYQSMDILNNKSIDYDLLGCGGTNKVWSTFYFNYTKRNWNHSLEEVIVATDNDTAGFKAYEEFVKQCTEKGFTFKIKREIPVAKDFNDDLVNLYYPQKEKIKEIGHEKQKNELEEL